MEDRQQKHNIVNGLDLYCSPSGIFVVASAGNYTANLTASFSLCTRDAALRLASVLAEAAMLLPETPEPVIVAPTTSYTEVYIGRGEP